MLSFHIDNDCQEGVICFNDSFVNRLLVFELLLYNCNTSLLRRLLSCPMSEKRVQIENSRTLWKKRKIAGQQSCLLALHPLLPNL